MQCMSLCTPDIVIVPYAEMWCALFRIAMYQLLALFCGLRVQHTYVTGVLFTVTNCWLYTEEMNRKTSLQFCHKTINDVLYLH